MNFIDLVLIFLMISIVALGFFQGMIRIGVLILAFYLSVVLASLYFPTVSNFLVNNFNAEQVAGDYIGFFLVALVGFALLSVAGLYTFRYAEMPDKLLYLDKTVGMFLGLILAVLITGLIAVLLWNLFITGGGRNIDLSLFRMVGNSVYNSFLLSYFADQILPQTYDLVRPILPDGARFIFEV